MGRTGSGKTQAGAWLLSRANWTDQPWIIIDTKYDDTILNDIDGVETIDLTKKLPKHAGLYITHPLPDQQEETERFLWRIWSQGRTGIFVDEGYMLPNSGPHGRGAFAAILTQGRSKHIPLIALVQRPAWVSRFLFSEADYHQVFRLLHSDDQTTVEKFVPRDMDMALPQYWSWWHDVQQAKVFRLRPVPDRVSLLTTFDDRFRQLREKRSARRWRRFISPGQSTTG